MVASLADRGYGSTTRRLRPSCVCLAAVGSPPLDLGSEPELDAVLAEVEDRPGHIFVPVLVDADRVVVREPEELGHPAGVDEVLDRNLPTHAAEITSIAGSVRGTA